MITVIFTIAGFACLIGFGIGVLIGAPLLLYTLPYAAWLGWNSGTKGIPKKLPSDKLPGFKNLTHSAKNATKLYKSWITKQPHGITDW